MSSNAIKCFLHGKGHLSTINVRIYDTGEKEFYFAHGGASL